MRTRSRRTALTLFAAGILVASVARADKFKMYQLQVYCENSQVATVIFGHIVTEPSMGTKVMCAGRCRGGMVPIADVLAGLPAEVSAALRAKVEKHEENAAAGKGRSLALCGGATKCNPELYADYLRKRQVAMELFQHGSDLRLVASKLVAERWGAETVNLGIEGGKEVGGDLAWERYGPQVTRLLGQSRGSLSETWVARQAVANAPFAVKAWNAIGWIDLAVQTTARGWLTAGDWSDYQKQAKKATKESEAMWRKALADFEADLKQAPQCLEESRRAAEEERNLDRAKRAIEEWDNNQALYWDPIRNEAVTFDAALKRADTYLKSGQISQWFRDLGVISQAFAATEPSQQTLEAAIRELDTAVASFERLNGLISKYLRAQKSIEGKLATAFAMTGKPPGPVAPKGTSLAKKREPR